MRIKFTKEKNGDEFMLDNLPDDAVISIEKNNTERDLLVQSADRKRNLAMIRGVESFAAFNMEIKKLPKKDWAVDGAS
jgi:hypothetical protein